jgi:LysR family transcriptional regulator for metE and metH
MPIKSLRFGEKGISKQIIVGIRKDEQDIDYLNDFIAQAKNTK